MFSVDVVIFGGGVSGLWLLDAVIARGYHALLLEAGALGAGQTIASQGIIHGGLKYTLDGLLNSAADALKHMPELWRDCLSGARPPDLRATHMRAEYCQLWRTGQLRSQVGMIGARFGLQVRPVKLDREQWPTPLARTAQVFRLDEQVLEPASMLGVLAAPHAQRLCAIDAREGLEIEYSVPGKVDKIRLAKLGEIAPRQVVFTAGAGNAELRERVGLPAAMQRRPLHMVMLRGRLPVLNGHCTDGAQTRVTITTTRDSAGRTVWQLGGQVAEVGTRMEPEELRQYACSELTATVPGLDLASVELSTYRVDRAGPLIDGNRRATEAWAERVGNVVTGWPVKLAHAPGLADRILALLEPPLHGASELEQTLPDWPRPRVAAPPWEKETTWYAAR
jgi:hypothetical protein